MPSRLPTLDVLLPPLDGRPFSRQEWDEQRAVRLALVMMTVVMHQQTFLDHHRPIPGGHDADGQWLHQHLEPLARVSPTVARIRSLFDPLLYGGAWANPAMVRKHLMRLPQAAVRMSAVSETDVRRAGNRRGS